MENRLDEQIKALLADRKGEWPQIAREAEVSHSWLSQFVRGKIGNPGYRTLVRLHGVLAAGRVDSQAEAA
jgi:transcriptional regulator with XRE-family HTH domain